MNFATLLPYSLVPASRQGRNDRNGNEIDRETFAFVASFARDSQ